MTIYRNSAEGGVHGVDVTAANSGGDSGDAWSNVVNGPGSTIVYDNTQAAHGVMSYLVSPAASQECALIKNLEAAVTTAQLSVYVRFDTAPAVQQERLATFRNSGGYIAEIQVDNSPFQFKLLDLNGNLHTFTGTLQLNTWYRVELRVIRGTTASDGTIEAAYYLGDSDTAIDSFSTAAANTGTTDITNARFGRPGATAGANPRRIDSIQVATGTDANGLGLVWNELVSTNVIAAAFPATVGFETEGSSSVGGTVDFPFDVGLQVTGDNPAEGHVDFGVVVGLDLVGAAPNDPPEGQVDFTFQVGLAITGEGGSVPAPFPPPPEYAKDVYALELGDEHLVLDRAMGLTVGSLDLGWPDVRTVVAQRPGVHGTIDTTSKYGARAVTLELTAVRQAGVSWQAALTRLQRFLAVDARPNLVYTHNGIDYRIGLAPDQSGTVIDNPIASRAQLGFRAPDPFLYAAGTTVATPSFQSGTTGRTYPWTAPRVYPESDAATGIVEVDNVGSVDAWPTVAIWGPLASSFTIENQTTGETFRMSTVTVDEGHRLKIDMRERTVRLDGDPTLSRFSAVNFAASQWLRLAPGVNRVRFSTGATPSDAVCAIEWSAPFLWPGEIPAPPPEPDLPPDTPTAWSVTETFNKPDGSLGPDLSWARRVYATAPQWQVVGNTGRLSASTPGEFNDLQLATTPADTSQALLSATVTDVTVPGAGTYGMTVGLAACVELLAADSDYRGYVARLHRTNQVAGIPLWFLELVRVEGGGAVTILGSVFADPAAVVLPGTLIFAAADGDLSAQFEHGGTVGPLAVQNVDGSPLPAGKVGLAGRLNIPAATTGAITIDNFAASTGAPT